MASASPSFWPTYMNPDNGAILPPTTTFYPTYMDPNNGAIFPSVTVTTTSDVYTTRASSRVYGAAASASNSGVEAVGDAYSSIASSSRDVMVSDMAPNSSYTGLTGEGGNSTSPDFAGSPTASSTSGDNGEPSAIKISVAAVPAIIGLILIVSGIWLCCRCKKRRRARREGEGGGGGGRGRYGEMSEVERAGASMPSTSTTHLTRPSDHAPPSLTRDEARGIVSPRTQWDRSNRDDRIDLIYPSRPQRAAHAHSLGPPPLSAYYHHPTSPAGTFGRAESRAGSSSRHSRWTDDTEYDVMAEDGSTITRTLSTTSTRRTLGPDETSLRGGTTAESVENPFDHPAYTYRAAPQRSATMLSRGNTSTMGTGTWSSSHHPPSLGLNSTLSPTSPLTPTAPIQSTHQESDAYSIHSSEDGIFGAAAQPSARVRPGIRRDPTIIRHADSFAAGPGRWSTTVERAGRDDAEVVELPPLYEDATSGWTR